MEMGAFRGEAKPKCGGGVGGGHEKPENPQITAHQTGHFSCQTNIFDSIEVFCVLWAGRHSLTEHAEGSALRVLPLHLERVHQPLVSFHSDAGQCENLSHNGGRLDKWHHLANESTCSRTRSKLDGGKNGSQG